jgi:hypothetical protein
METNKTLKKDLDDETNKAYCKQVEESITPTLYWIEGGSDKISLLHVHQKQLHKVDRMNAVDASKSVSHRKRKRPQAQESNAQDTSEEEATAFLASVRERRGDDTDRQLTQNPQLLKTLDRYGNSALHISAKVKDNAAMIECLLKHGMAVNARTASNSSTPLHQAAYCEDVANVKCLLDHGADPLAVTSGRWLPVHNAANTKNKRQVESETRGETIDTLMDAMLCLGRTIEPAPKEKYYNISDSTAEKYPLLRSQYVHTFV